MTNSPLDLDTIGTLRDIMAQEFTFLLDTFLADLPKKIADLRAAAQQGEVSHIEMLAHTLKGSSGNIGAIGLSAACAELVDAVRGKNYENYESLIEQVAAQIELVTPLLREQRH